MRKFSFYKNTIFYIYFLKMLIQFQKSEKTDAFYFNNRMLKTYVTSHGNMYVIFIAEMTFACLDFLFYKKGINQTHNDFNERLTSCFHFQSSLSHCFQNSISFLRTPEISFCSTMKWFPKAGQDAFLYESTLVSSLSISKCPC